jgi:hypothetical protein
MTAEKVMAQMEKSWQVASEKWDCSGWDLEFSLSDWFRTVVDDKGDDMSGITGDRRDWQQRFDAVGWGLLFLLFGVLGMPNGTTQYAAAVAVGAAMLGLNLVRIFAAVPIRWFSVILGGSFLIGGTGALAGVHMDVVVVFFVLAGIVAIAGAVVGPRRAAAQ